MSKQVCGLACAIVMLGTAQAADLSKTGPLASAESIINARAQFREEGIEFSVAITGGGAPGTWAVDLAPDFNVTFDGNVKSTTVDYALKRVIALDDSAHSIVNSSLYAMVDFRIAETANRRLQRGALEALKAPNKSLLDAFWVQSELQILDPADGTPKIGRRQAKDGGVTFSYAGKDVASYTLSKQTMTKEEASRLSRYLYTNTSLHPTIIDEIVAAARMPARISYSLPPMRKQPPVVMMFKPFVPVKAIYPLRKGEKLEPLGAGSDPAAATLQSLLQIMEAATAGQAPGHRGVEDFRTAIEKALGDDHPFQALVLVLEAREQYGDTALQCPTPAGDCHTLAQIGAAAKSEPRAVALVDALKPGQGNLDAAIATLKAMKRDDLSNPYVIDDFLANDLATSGHPDDAMPLFARAIKANPYVAGYYKDLGDAYREQYQPVLAWLCYDIGRTLPGGANAPVISGVTSEEARMEAKVPQFF